ncbi:cell division control 14, SIN component [Daldinia loculata]|uniref:cell division control 14, SIN component n=1 Tax=Daldinia loculata TaxID=103429 RepID=UPI0020C4E146|nr:cell division control 14, SIN component [Daldinia loculata]KAI1649089.1 cell division control 14, SIN component [Daldinia loculata]KAI2779741.1 cell division control 14, SIN component [Daldinia loculata]
MENLLSLAFDNLSSYDSLKIRKGLRQVEGLLANICLSRSQGKERRGSVITQQQDEQEPLPPKTLDEITDDPAFYEFFKLQEGFEWNVAMRLVNTLDRLLARGNDGSNDLLILSALDLVQGVMLLHPPSKAIFSREMHMNLLLDLLEPDFCPAIQSATVVTLVTALVDAPRNTRTFETLDGLLTITSLFRNRCTSRDVKLKLVEFLYFYLMPEVPSIPSARAAQDLGVPPLLQRSPSKLAKAFAFTGAGRGAADGARPKSAGDGETRTQEEKQALLGRHLSSVQELVEDLRQNTPFGGVVM